MVALLIGAGAIAAGLVLSWSALVAVGVGVCLIPCAGWLMRPPRAVQWWDAEAPTRVTRGDPATLRIGVRVVGSARWLRAVATTGEAWPVGDEVVCPIDTSRRGRFPVGPNRLEHADPFGLRRRTLAQREPGDVLVVPRISPVGAVAGAGAGAEGLLGERMGQDHVASLREYVVGDPRKLIHWRASAHTGSLMVRRMVDVTVPCVMVVLDVDQAHYPRAGSLFAEFDEPGFETAVDLAASWAWAAALPQQRVLLTTTAAEAALVEVNIRNREASRDWLALVSALPASACLPSRIGAVARQHPIARIVLVTGRLRAGTSGVTAEALGVGPGRGSIGGAEVTWARAG